MQAGLRLVAIVLGTGCGAGLAAVPNAVGGGQAELLQCLERIPTVVGTPADDVLPGTYRDDVIVGLGGDDVIMGREGHDVICGGDGNDRIAGGIEFLESDLLSGDAGDDVVVAGPTATVVVYAFAPGAVRVDLGAGTATGWGTDTLVGVHNVVGSRFDDMIRGGEDFNCLDGDAGNDVLLGLDGDDCLYGSTGSDTLDGGPGIDTTAFQHVRKPMTVNLAAGFARGEGLDQVASIEEVIGTGLPDVLTGDARSNELEGGGGGDRLAGGPGTDRLDGGAGRDRVDGGVGRDRCVNAERRSRCP
jgi:Ca2+-binding RTX toxin-like protein